MTSKEKLTSLVSALEVIGETTIKKDVVKQYKKDIEKDLEILEILKERATLEHDAINENYKWITINMSNQDARFNKLEEWLNEV